MLSSLLLGVISNGLYDISKGITNLVLNELKTIIDPSVQETCEQFTDLKFEDFSLFFGSELVDEEIRRMQSQGYSLRIEKMIEIH